jgi:hypothetical protein
VEYECIQALELLLDAGADIAYGDNRAIKNAAPTDEAIIGVLVDASRFHPSVRYYSDNGTIYIIHRIENGETNVPSTQVFCTDLTRMNPDFLQQVLATSTAKSAAS